MLSRLFKTLAASEDYSYGLLIPFISLYIAYLKWPRLSRRTDLHPSWLGLAVMALGLSLYIVGELAADLYVPRFSFVVVLA